MRMRGCVDRQDDLLKAEDCQIDYFGQNLVLRVTESMLGLPDAMTNLQVVLDYFWQNIFECNFVFLVHVLRVISDVFDDNLLQGCDIHLLV